MFDIKKFTFNPFQENTYLVRVNDKAVLIDPGMSNAQEENEFKHFLTMHQLNLEAVWLTHAHIDHIMGISFIQSEFGVPIFMHSLESDNLQSGPLVASAYGIPFSEFEDFKPHPLDDMDKIEIGEESFDIIFAPGHSVGHVCFHHRASQQLIGGDVLFRQSIGRADLPGGDFETLKKSIQTQLYTLEDSTIVYPGHGPETSIRYEKVNNAFVKASTA